MNGTRRLVELIVLGGSALVVSGAFVALFLEGEQTGLDGNPAWRLLLAINYAAVAWVLIPWYRETLYVLRRNWALASLLAIAVLSSMWAEMPDLVLRRSIGLLGTTLFGIALAVRLSYQEQLQILKWLFRIVAILSLACVVLLPSYGISSEGEWKGVFEYKNAMGSMMGLSLLLESQLRAATAFEKLLKCLAMVLCAFLLLKSDSVTPGVALVGALILLNTYKFLALRLRVPLYAFFGIIAVPVLAGLSVVVAKSESVLSFLGRSSNLTGRTEIWSLVISFIPQKPILGYGYSGFWMGASPESFVVNRVLGGPIMYSHNGYLEMFLSLGVIGFVLTLGLIGAGMKRALYLSRQRQFGTELWPLAFLLYFVLHNLGECTILMQELEWAMCVSCIVGTDLLLSYTTEEEAELPLIPLKELG
jgi:exopolysaccharide production protein ExoQ